MLVSRQEVVAGYSSAPHGLEVFADLPVWYSRDLRFSCLHVFSIVWASFRAHLREHVDVHRPGNR